MCVYNKVKGDNYVIISMYINVMLIFKTNESYANDTKRLLSSSFDMKDLGQDNVVLGIKIIINDNGIILIQSKYIEKFLRRFNSFDCKSTPTFVDTSKKN